MFIGGRIALIGPPFVIADKFDKEDVFVEGLFIFWDIADMLKLVED
jgi:hypothetical protein